jgi:RimJ/RimL family protein N-acetyltransferase
MVTLRPAVAEDIPRLLRWISTPRMLIQWAGPDLFQFPLDVQQLQAYFRMSEGDAATSRLFAVEDCGTGTVVGHCELGALNRDQGTASVCRVVLDPGQRGGGLCFPMMRELLRIAFRDFDLRRVSLRVAGHNTAAIRCYKRAGFVQEGVLRRATMVDGECWDVVVMAVLRDEWESGSFLPSGEPV